MINFYYHRKQKLKFYRFESYAVNHKLSHKSYRESLGIIGIESLSFMCDRMFNVMDKDKDGYVSGIKNDILYSKWLDAEKLYR